ncbi:MAG TPA: hypothetical protein VFS95_02275 [Telluria sp.]|nr:hypothetical protein [Telluria sp.]
MRATRPTMAAMALCALLSAQALAQEPQKDVVIKGLKDPELRSFRSVTVGLDTFDEYHKMAPAVPALHFKLRPRAASVEPDAEPITLKIVGDSDPILVPIDAEGRFTIARNQQAYDEKAELIFNRKRRQATSIADIHTPGVPDNARRLGDLRLECLVNVAIIKTEIPFLVKATVNTLLLTTDWCRKLPIFMSLPPQSKTGKISLVQGERRLALTQDQLYNGFESPLLDPVWTDDALVEFEFAKQE